MSKRALVVGLGAAGSRHVKTLESLGAEVVALSRRQQVGDFDLFLNSEMDLSSFEIVVVALETSMHLNALTAVRASNFSGLLLLEKPGLVDFEDVSKIESFASGGGERVAYNLRYLDGLQYLKQTILNGHTPVRVSIICRSDLSRWRPGDTRPDQYSNWLELGGGALNDLTHEIDYLRWLLGDIVYVAALGGKLGHLVGDADDSWKIICKSQSAHCSVDLSVISKREERKCVVEFEDFAVEVNLSTGRISDTRYERVIQGNQIKDTYKIMMRDVIESGGLMLPSLESNMRLLRDLMSIRLLAWNASQT